MNRYHLLAAEIFGYSYANYDDHLGIDHIRYETLMPDTARTLERAEAECWPLEKVARELELDELEAARMTRAFQRARDVVDAENPAESFRWAVRQCIEHAIHSGLGDEPSIERLLTQICYRAADLAFLLDRKGETLSQYSERLREIEYGEPDLDD
jgi:hypothetical protein